MSTPAKNEMDVDAFLVWGEGRDGRWELRDGQPVKMAPERAAHALTKLSAYIALINGVQRAGLLVGSIGRRSCSLLCARPCR